MNDSHERTWPRQSKQLGSRVSALPSEPDHDRLQADQIGPKCLQARGHSQHDSVAIMRHHDRWHRASESSQGFCWNQDSLTHQPGSHHEIFQAPLRRTTSGRIAHIEADPLQGCMADHDRQTDIVSRRKHIYNLTGNSGMILTHFIQKIAGESSVSGSTHRVQAHRSYVLQGGIQRMPGPRPASSSQDEILIVLRVTDKPLPGMSTCTSRLATTC